MYIFKSKKEKFYNPEIGFYHSYSIEMFKRDSNNRICYIPDVFVSFKNAQEFVDICNEYQPEPVHLEELCISFIE